MQLQFEAISDTKFNYMHDDEEIKENLEDAEPSILEIDVVEVAEVPEVAGAPVEEEVTDIFLHPKEIEPVDDDFVEFLNIIEEEE